MFLGLPDPDPLVRGMDPDPNPDPSIIKQNTKNLDSYCFVTAFFTFILSVKNDVNVHSKINKQEYCTFERNYFCWLLEGQ
jgi:hypothetical protein